MVWPLPEYSYRVRLDRLKTVKVNKIEIVGDIPCFGQSAFDRPSCFVFQCENERLVESYGDVGIGPEFTDYGYLYPAEIGHDFLRLRRISPGKFFGLDKSAEHLFDLIRVLADKVLRCDNIEGIPVDFLVTECDHAVAQFFSREGRVERKRGDCVDVALRQGICHLIRLQVDD